MKHLITIVLVATLVSSCCNPVQVCGTVVSKWADRNLYYVAIRTDDGGEYTTTVDINDFGFIEEGGYICEHMCTNCFECPTR